jgi:cobalt-zinc-cadmium efflux system protein
MAHVHGPPRMRPLAATLALTAAFTAVEVVGGLLTGSLALLADAGHMLGDNLSLGLALFAMWLARRPATPERSFGFRRAEILAALANGVTLVAVAIWIVVEAWDRLRDPPEVLGGWMLAVAVAGLAVNVAGALILMRGDRASLNVQAALRHVVADLLGSAGVLVAAVVILVTGWAYADPLVSVAIALLILASSWTVLRDSVNVLLESTPGGMDAREIASAIGGVPGVVDVHDLHVWTITSGFPALSAHVLVRPGDDCHAARRLIEGELRARFGISHTTLQVDHSSGERLLSIR